MAVRLPTGQDLDRLMAGPPRMASTALGPVEYAEAGHGPVLLSVDGSFGGWDYAMGQAAVFAVNGFRVIAPSRPGYLGTPLELGRSHEEQAEVLIALLDSLGVDRAAVLALCGGAGSSFVMAARHPERVSCLVEVSPVTVAYVPDTGLIEGWLNRLMMGSPAAMTVWMGAMGVLLRRFPETAVRLFLAPPESTLDRAEAASLAHRIMTDPYRAAFATRVWATFTNHTHERFAGTVNEMAQVAAITGLPLAEVTCPTLVVSGLAQTLPAGNIEAIRDAIPSAEVRTPERGIHRGPWLDDDWAEQQRHVLGWVREQVGQDRTTGVAEGTPPDDSTTLPSAIGRGPFASGARHDGKANLEVSAGSDR